MVKLRIVLADDHEGFRRTLSSFLNAQTNVEVVAEACDGYEAVEQTERFQPDVVLMDMHMPVQNGIEATRVIKGRWPNTRVIILSMDSGEFYSATTRAIADGFIPKSSMKMNILQMIATERSRRALSGVAA